MKYSAILSLICVVFSMSLEADTAIEKSDHFDGERFFNAYQLDIQPIEKPSVWNRARDFFNSTSWPDEIKNNAHEPLYRKPLPDAVVVTFINHATVLIQVDGLTLLTDPIWSERASPSAYLGPQRVRSPGIALNDLPKIDVILLSHNHYDHMDLPSLEAISQRDSPVIITGLGNRAILEKNAIPHSIELDWWQSTVVHSVPVHFVPAIHGSARSLVDRDKTLWGGFVVQTQHGNLFFAGDTAYGNHFRAIAKRFGSFRLALLPIGHYLPRWMMQGVHMSPEEAVKAHQDLSVQTSIGIHFGTFHGMGSHNMEAIGQPEADLRSALSKYAIANERFSVLDVGESVALY